MKRRKRRAPLGALLLLLLLALLLPLGDFLAGTFPGGGRRPAEGGDREALSDPGGLRIRVVSGGETAPVEGALVSVEGLSGGVVEGVTGADGTLRVDRLPSGPVRVRARWGGGESAEWVDPSRAPRVELALGRPRERSGRVLGGSTACILLLDRDGAVLARTQADAEGRYRLDDDARASFVAALTDGGAAAVARGGDLDLASGVPLTGRVAGAQEAREIALHALIPSSGEDEQAILRWTAALEGDGAFAVRFPAGARIWGVVGGRPVELREGVNPLPAAARARGRVLAPGGAPASRATLRFTPLGEGDAPTPLPALRAETDAGGSFDVEGLADIAYSLEVGAPECATRRLALFRPAAGEVEIRLEPGYTMHGTVVDRDGFPVRDAEVLGVGLPDPEQERPLARDRTDDRGRFRLAGLGGDSATIRVAAPGFHPTTLPGSPPGRPLRVVLQRQ